MADEQPRAAAGAELYASLRADPDDEASWSVLGDLLAVQGDAHGELIALDQRRATRVGERSLEHQVVEHRIAELFDRHVGAWLGPLARVSNLELTWRRGFLLAATIHGRAADAAKGRAADAAKVANVAAESRDSARSSSAKLDVATTLARLLDLPAAALLRELTLPRLSACAKPAKLIAKAATEGRAQIQTLALPWARCDRFESLAELSELRSLVLSSTTPRDLAELSTLAKLERLDLARSHSDLRGFERGFERLRMLDLRAHPNVASAPLDALAGLTGLRELDLGEGGWDSVRGLATLAGLERLHLRGTDVFDLRPLTELGQLRMLDLRGCPVADLEPIAGLTELRELRIGWTRVRELRDLRSLAKLEVLEIAGTAVSNLEPLFDLPALVRVDVQGSDVRDVRALSERGVQVIGRPQVQPPTWREVAEGLLRE